MVNLGTGFGKAIIKVARRARARHTQGKHSPFVAVQQRKIQRASFETNIDGHFSCRLVRATILLIPSMLWRQMHLLA